MSSLFFLFGPEVVFISRYAGAKPNLQSLAISENLLGSLNAESSQITFNLKKSLFLNLQHRYYKFVVHETGIDSLFSTTATTLITVINRLELSRNQAYISAGDTPNDAFLLLKYCEE